MNTTWPQNRNTASNPGAFSWWWLTGLVIGLLALTLSQLPKKWFLTIFGGLIVMFVALSVEDRKKFFLILLVLSLPIGMSKTFFFTRSPVFRSSYGFTVYLAHLPLFALYTIWFFRRVTRKVPMPMSTRGLLPFAGLFFMAFLSGMMANKLFAIFDLYALAIMGLMFIYVASEIREERELRLVIALIFATGIIQAIIAIAQNLSGSSLGLEFFGGGKFLTGYVGLLTLTRVAGTLGHPGTLAKFFDLIIPLTFSLLFYPMSKPSKLLLFIVVVTEFIGLGMSYSRSGIFWTIIMTGIILLIQLCRRLGVARGAFTTVAIGTLFVCLLLVVPNPLQKGLFRTEMSTAYGRLPLMEVAVNIIRNNPFLGVGLNNYVQAAKKYDFTPEQLTTVWDTAVHNIYLYVAGEIGLIGLFFLLCLLGTVLWNLVPTLRSPDPFIVCVGLGMLGGLLTYLIHWLTDLAPWTSDRLLWFMLGLSVAIGRLNDASLETGSCPKG